MKFKRLTLTLTLALGLTLGLLVSLTLAAPGNPDPEPDPNTHTASPETTVALTYDEAMDAATVTSHTFAVHAFQTGLLTATHGVQGNTMLVTPLRPFHAGELVQTTATTRTLSITGEQPLSYTVWGFRAAVDGGSGVFAPHPSVPTFGGGDSNAVALGDLDGDGDLDAVVANDSGQAQDVHLNAGNGAFGMGSTFGAGWSSDVALGDVDGDGDLDAVVANALGVAQDVYLNDGAGALSSHAVFGGGDSSAVALGDVDGDGDLDAVVANSGEAQDVYLNAGAGTFVAHPTSSTFGAGWSTDVILGDLDSDGDLDVVVANDAAAQGVYLNDGGGGFASHPITPTFGGGDSNAVTLGDLDGDGDLDAVVANDDGQAQDVYLNDGNGGFYPGSTFGAGDSSDVALGDLDGDGDLDAVIANDGAAQEVYLNDGSGGFIPLASTFGGGASSAIALGDVSGDGDLDAVVANVGAAQTVWLNRGRIVGVAPGPNSHGVPLDAGLVVTTSAPASPASVTSRTLSVHGSSHGHVNGDFSFDVPGESLDIHFQPDGDWFPGELVQTSVTTGVLESSGVPIVEPYVWEFRAAAHGGSGAFVPHPSAPTFGDDAFMNTAIVLGDVDGDGDLDAVTVSDYAGPRTVYFNDGSGDLSQGSVGFGGGLLSQDVALGDVDGDGDLDVVAINSSQANDVYLNDGSGDFYAHPTAPTFGGATFFRTGLALGDMDGDSDLDAVDVGTTNGVYLNNGAGVFADHSYTPTFGADGSAVALGDVDGDGDLDAIVVRQSDSEQVYLNNGSGGLTLHDTFADLPTGGETSVALGDLDGDGDLDAFMTTRSAAELACFNNGDGEFPSCSYVLPPSYIGRSGGEDAALGDIDGDGDLDAVVARTNAPNTPPQGVYLNDGSGAFTYHPITPDLGGNESFGVALGDLDGDGDLDAVVANYQSAGASGANTTWLNQDWVTGVAPTPNSHDASLDAGLVITTNTPVAPSSVTSRTVFVHGDFQGHIRGTFGFDSIHFDPDGDWFPGELVQTSVTTGVLDSSGVSLALPYVWQFRTATQGGSGFFTPHPVTPTAAGAGYSQDVALGDLDGDGDLDVIAANTFDAPQDVFLNDGRGGFTLSSAFGVGQSNAVALGDVDGDGDLDAIVANGSGEAQNVYLNNGSGGFYTPTISSTFGAGRSSAVALGDVDGDGDLDAIVANSSGEAQDVYLNDGSGAFVEHPISPTFGAGISTDIALGDVDGDGDLDAVVANYGPQDVYLNDGGGGFYTPTISSTFGTDQSMALALGDLDGDGDLDAVVANNDSAQGVYLNNGSGGFYTPTSSYTFGRGFDIALGDVDGDGDLDAILANSGGDQHIHLNDGSGSFAEHSAFAREGDSYDVALGDIDGDGDLDAIVGNFGVDLTIWLNQAAVTDVSPAPNSHDAPLDADIAVITSNPISYTSVTSRTMFVHGGYQGHVSGLFSFGSILFDPDGDWFPGELVQTSVTSGVLDSSGLPIVPYVWGFRASTQGGSGTFAPHPISPTFGITNSDSYGIALGDLDGDGDLDAIVANMNDQPESVYLNNGSGGFYTSTLTPTLGGSNSTDVALGDVDGDGDLDAVVANIGAAQDVYLNDGSGGFYTPTISSTFGGTEPSVGVDLGDVDGDGDLDAVVVNFGASPLNAYLNDNGGFYPHPISPTFGAGYSRIAAALGDVDGDGDLDVVVVNAGGGRPEEVYLNDGRGVFAAPSVSPTFGTGSSSNAVALGDVDGDGDLDAVIANVGDQPQDVCLNNGSGGFACTATFGAGQTQDVALGDLDGDGDLDAVLANDKQSQNAYLNDGSGTFTERSTFGPSDSKSQRVALGDVDGDGDLDAVVANVGAVQAVWLNQSRADLSITKTVEPDVAAPGAPIAYTLTFLNNGPDAATHIAISDSVPVSVTMVSDEWSAGVEITRTAGVTFEWTVSNLAAGQSGVITITGWLSDALPHGYAFTNTATITGVVVDTDTLNNEDAASITVDAQAPDAPVLLSPADGALINDATPTLTWQASAALDVAGYLLDFDGAVSDVGDVTESTTALLADGAYTWTVAAYDAVDNTSAYTDTWSFSVDATPPQVTGFSPADGAQNVALDAVLVITFSEAVQAGSLDYTVMPDPGGWSATWGGGTAVLPGGSVVTLTHAAFDPETTYSVTVSAATDGAGNPLAAPAQWSFTTLDITPPTVTAVSPPDGAQDVALGAAVIITFSEAINTSTLSYSVSPDPGGWAAAWSGGDSVVTLSHDAFEPETTYSVTVSAADDLAGNPLSNAPYEWSFVTSVSDADPPTVEAVSPPDGTQEVAVDAAVVITFSEAINTSTFVYGVSLDPGGWGEAWSGGDTVVTLSHNDLAYSTTYTVTVSAAADLAGNPLSDAPYVWSFATMPARLYLPLVLKGQ